MFKEWGDADKQLFLSLDETELTDPNNVHEIVSDFWVPVLQGLPDEELPTDDEAHV